MKIFLTGGSGFLGGHVIEQLLKKGHQVVAMARSDSGAAIVEGFGATAARHSAARVEEWGTRAQFWSANVEGTAAMLKAAHEAGVRRFVHVGTEAVVFSGSDLTDIDETYPYPSKHRYLYSETKAEAERLVLAAAEAGQMEAISVRPRLIWGPRDTSVLPTVLKMHRKGAFAWIDGGKQLTSTTHVYNVVHALELALTRGAPGRAYFVLDEGKRSIREFLTQLVLSASGETLGSRSMPSRLARPLAVVVEGLWRLLRIQGPPPMSRFAIDMMSSTLTIRDERARIELGYKPILTVEEGMTELAALRASV
jgi:nucleoside-diphosphate-sugar epimerase